MADATTIFTLDTNGQLKVTVPDGNVTKDIILGNVSSYALAIQQGYTGTLNQWLESIRGQSISAIKINADGHFIVTYHDYKTNTDSIEDIGTANLDEYKTYLESLVQEAKKYSAIEYVDGGDAFSVDNIIISGGSANTTDLLTIDGGNAFD